MTALGGRPPVPLSVNDLVDQLRDLAFLAEEVAAHHDVDEQHQQARKQYHEGRADAYKVALYHAQQLQAVLLSDELKQHPLIVEGREHVE